MGRSTEFYRKNAKARKKKQEYNSKEKKKRKNVIKRVESTRARRKARREGKNIDGKDAAHTKNGIVFKDPSRNRGSKTDQPGDRRARGKKRTTKSKK